MGRCLIKQFLPVVIQNRIEPVSNGKDSGGFELCTDGVLDKIVCVKVYGGRGFVQNEYARFPEQGTGET